MEASEALLGIAEIAVGIAGFAGVAAAILLQRSLQRDDQLRFLSLFFSAISVVFLAFLPLFLAWLGLPGDAVWRWASAGFVTVALMAIPLGITIAKEARHFEKVPPRWAVLPLWGLFCLAPVLQLTNILGRSGDVGAVFYIGGLLAWLGAGAILFVIIVLLRSPKSKGD